LEKAAAFLQLILDEHVTRLDFVIEEIALIPTKSFLPRDKRRCL
jgi:hypothetical protein